MSVHNNIAFPVVHRFVKASERLHPVTHSFIVKRGEGGEYDWLDDFQGEILECYNSFSIGHPRSLGPIGFGTLGGHVSFEMTYAVINLEHRSAVNWNGNTESWGDSFGSYFQRVQGQEGFWMEAAIFNYGLVDYIYTHTQR